MTATSATDINVVPRRAAIAIGARGGTDEPLLKADDHHDYFFWTYTEEPHRTRRQAIIKAHPEVRTDCSFSAQARLIYTFMLGHEALRARTIDQVHCPWSCL